MKNITFTLNTWLDVITNLNLGGNETLLIKLIQKSLNYVSAKDGVQEWASTLVNVNLTNEQYHLVIQALPPPKMNHTPTQLKIIEIKNRKRKRS